MGGFRYSMMNTGGDTLTIEESEKILDERR